MMGLHAPAIAVVVFTNNALYCRIVFTADSADLSFICTHPAALCFIIELMRDIDKILKRKAAVELPFPALGFQLSPASPAV